MKTQTQAEHQELAEQCLYNFEMSIDGVDRDHVAVAQAWAQAATAHAILAAMPDEEKAE